MAASEAAAAMAARWPSGEGGGSVGSALAWFDAPHRPGVSDLLVNPETAPAGGQQRGMPRRPTPPAARRLKPPHVPRVLFPGDRSNFDPYNIEERGLQKLPAADNALFRSFG